MADLDYRYRWTALDGGGFGVFVEHYRGEHAGWWRLVAQFGEQGRAESYAEIENVLLEDGSVLRYSDEEIAPDMLPRLPASGVTVERLSETAIVMGVAVEELLPAPPDPPNPPPHAGEDVSPELPEPMSDIPCARCGTLLSLGRAKHPKARYCTNECSAAATKERFEANRKTPIDPELCLGCGARLPAVRWRGFQYCNQDCLDRHALAIGAAPDIRGGARDCCGAGSDPVSVAAPPAPVAPKQEPAPFRAPIRTAQPAPKPAPKVEYADDDAEIAAFLAKNGARHVMSPEQVALFLRDAGHEAMIRVEREATGNTKNNVGKFRDKPVPILDGKECSLAHLYDAANKLRAAAGLSALSPPG